MRTWASDPGSGRIRFFSYGHTCVHWAVLWRPAGQTPVSRAAAWVGAGERVGPGPCGSPGSDSGSRMFHPREGLSEEVARPSLVNARKCGGLVLVLGFATSPFQAGSPAWEENARVEKPKVAGAVDHLDPFLQCWLHRWSGRGAWKD